MSWEKETRELEQRRHLAKQHNRYINTDPVFLPAWLKLVAQRQGTGTNLQTIRIEYF